jgi:hypothetical protein
VSVAIVAGGSNVNLGERAMFNLFSGMLRKRYVLLCVAIRLLVKTIYDVMALPAWCDTCSPTDSLF